MTGTISAACCPLARRVPARWRSRGSTRFRGSDRTPVERVTCWWISPDRSQKLCFHPAESILIPGQSFHSRSLRLNRFIAESGPSFKITFTASSAVSSIRSTIFQSDFRMGESKYCFPSDTFRSGATPIRIRRKSCVPSASMIDSMPLCPAELRRL